MASGSGKLFIDLAPRPKRGPAPSGHVARDPGEKSYYAVGWRYRVAITAWYTGLLLETIAVPALFAWWANRAGENAEAV